MKKKVFSIQTYRFKKFSRKAYSVFNSIQKSITIGVLAGSTLLSASAATNDIVDKKEYHNTTDSIPTAELEELTVTASKAALPVNLVAKQVTIITSRDLSHKPVRSIEDLLDYNAGIDILQRGPHGVQSDISLRGGSFDQTAILINGVNLSNPHTGHYSFDLPINLSDIKQIEVIQGPSSLAFGASAFSGGINIITKNDIQNSAFLELQGGMHGLFGIEGRGSYNLNNTTQSLSIGYKHSDGYIKNSDYDIHNIFWQSMSNINNSKLYLQAGVNDKKYGANTFYSASYPNQFDKTRRLFFSIKAESYGKLKLTPHIFWSRHYDEFQLFRDGTQNIPDWYTNHNYHRSEVFGVNLNMQYASKLGLTNFGGEFRNEGILSNVLGKDMEEAIDKYTKSDNRSNISYFAEHNFLFKSGTISIGGLLNYNTAIINKFNFYPSINSTYRFNDKFSIYASWNTATRMPTFTDLYYTTKTHIGNVNLHAEKSEAFEFGSKYSHNGINGSLSVFYMKGKNMIDWVKKNEEDKWESTNHTQLDKKGIEVAISADMSKIISKTVPLQLNAGYMYLDQNRVDDTLISNYALNHLRHKFTADLHYTILNSLTISCYYRWQERNGSYIEYKDLVAGERVNFKPFSIVDIKMNYNLNNLNLFVNANNIFDVIQVDIGNIPQPGFWLSGGINYTLK
ncbi:MAG: TonB-dependent receptor plug domain-containing protein [Fermentimonas sp.]|jgi:vitamin B12 transporter